MICFVSTSWVGNCFITLEHDLEAKKKKIVFRIRINDKFRNLIEILSKWVEKLKKGLEFQK